MLKNSGFVEEIEKLCKDKNIEYIDAVVLCHTDEPRDESGWGVEPFQRIEHLQEYLLCQILGILEIRGELINDIEK